MNKICGEGEGQRLRMKEYCGPVEHKQIIWRLPGCVRSSLTASHLFHCNLHYLSDETWTCTAISFLVPAQESSVFASLRPPVTRRWRVGNSSGPGDCSESHALVLCQQNCDKWWSFYRSRYRDIFWHCEGVLASKNSNMVKVDDFALFSYATNKCCRWVTRLKVASTAAERCYVCACSKTNGIFSSILI